MEPTLVPDLLASDAMTLRLVATPAACRLLQLPAELREMIYQYTLLEPRLWERRHRPTCDKYNPAVGVERPPFAIVDKVKVEVKEEYYEDDDDNVDAERETQKREVWRYRTHTCAKRRGLGLLAVNKQIRSEASPIFWRNTTFCFDDLSDFSCVMPQAPSVLNKIVSLSVMTFGEDCGLRIWGFGMFETMSKMKHPEEIELEQIFLRYRLKDFLTLRSLKVVRVLEIENSCMAVFKPWEQWLYMALPREFEMPHCDGEIHMKQKVQGVGGWPACPQCLPKMQEIQRETAILPQSLRGWAHRVARDLERRNVSQTSEDLFTVPVPLRHSDRYMDIGVWGLPTSPVSKHQRAYWREQAEAKGTWPGPRQPRPVAFVSEQQEEAKLANKGRTARSYKCQQQRVDSDQQARIQSRIEARSEEAKQEAAGQKKSSKKEARLKKKGEREMHEEKKAAKKRSHRR